MSSNPHVECEYIVVGSGAGGGPLAATLAKAGRKVLLLEAGDDDEPPNYQVPVFHALASEDEALSWQYFVRHHTDDVQQRRDSKFTAARDGVFYPRAGTLGGCTAHHAMITVYPHNSDWDQIAALTGDQSWLSGNMRKYFERLERCNYRPGLKILNRMLRWNPTRHGFRGWLPTNVANPLLILRDRALIEVIKDAVAESLEELPHAARRAKRGIKALLDPNDWALVRTSGEGVRFTPLSTSGGRRAGTREYLREVQRMFPDRLEIRLGALVTKVLLDDTLRATGVEYLEGKHLYRADPRAQQSASTVKRSVHASREVILAAGAFNTPQLLMLSGIGPREELTRHGLPVRVDLPGVGENLQDRYEVGLVYRMKKDFVLLEGATFQAPGPGGAPDPHFRDWQRGRGVYTTNGAVLSIIKRSHPSRPEPDLFIFGLAGRFRGYYPGYSREVIRHSNYFTWAVLKAHTGNTAGRVTLRSADPRDPPRINFRYFSEGNDGTGDDLESVVDGVEFVRGIMERVGGDEEEEVPGTKVRTRDDVRQFIKNEAWGHHASCTCKMGTSTDPTAVVDSRFRVHGTVNLRVVDASVFPRIPGFFIVTPIYMIAEKAADVVLEDAGRSAT